MLVRRPIIGIMLAVLATPVFAAQMPTATSASVSREPSLKQLAQLTAARSYFAADAEANKLLQRYPNDLDVLLAAARLHRDMGLSARAEAEYLKVLQRKPDLPEACAELSSIYLQKLDISKALNYAQRAFNTSPKSETQLAYATALLAAGKFREVDRELRNLLKTDPENPQVQYIAYELAISLNEHAQAQKYLESAVNMAPTRADWLIELSELYKEAGEYVYARKSLERALMVDPGSLEALNKLAVIYEFYLHDYDKAMDQYKNILQIDQESVTALAGLDRCKVKKNDLAGAMKFELQSILTDLFNVFNKSHID